MSLFQTGDFTLRSGAKSKWKIECDALDEGDWAALALMALPHLPRYGAVYGVPKGGLPFAQALLQYITPLETLVLIAEDVVTTGGSMERHLKGLPLGTPEVFWGVTVFARGKCPSWVTPLFQMPYD